MDQSFRKRLLGSRHPTTCRLTCGGQRVPTRWPCGSYLGKVGPFPCSPLPCPCPTSAPRTPGHCERSPKSQNTGAPERSARETP